MLTIKIYALVEGTLQVRVGNVSDVFGDMGSHADFTYKVLEACQNDEEFRHYFINQINTHIDCVSIIDFQLI